MRRRDLLVLITGTIGCAWSPRSVAHAKTRLVGALLASTEGDLEMQARLAAFTDTLATFGWIAGTNLRIEPRWMAGEVGQAAAEAFELLAFKPDVIVANSTTGIDALLKATSNIPTVFVMVGDPVGRGYVSSLAHPGANVTGFSAFDPEIAGKWVQVLKEIAPAVTRATVVFQGGHEFLARAVPDVGPSLGLEVTPVLCQTSADIESAIAAASEPHCALIVIPSVLFVAHRDLMIRAAELVVNVKTANDLNLTVPASLLARADAVIE